MKYFITLLSFLIVTNSFAQNANTYFPVSTGYKWLYKNTPLDSNNNPNPNLSTYRVDSFAVNTTYVGLPASIVLSKPNLLSIGQNTPYTDTNALNFQTTNAWKYISIGYLDTLPVGGLLNFLKGLEGWYSVFRFASTINSSYTIFSKDTTIAYDTINLPLRFSLTGKRLNDETVSTVNGNYSSKKFVLNFQVLYVLPFPFPAIPIMTNPDTSWIAQNVWMVKEVTPSTRVNLTTYGVPINTVTPGQITELTLPVGINNISSEVPADFKLYQNYPNPFNPPTKIKFSIPQSVIRSGGKNQKITLRVFDLLGKEVSTLVNQELQPGSYEVSFDAAALSSGTYFYRMEIEYPTGRTNGYSEVKRMSLIK